MSKVWVITGAARGLGRSITETVLAQGDRVLATARDVSRLADLAQQYGQKLGTFALDVTDEAQASAAVEHAVSLFGRVDVLVNNAGYGQMQPFEHVSSDDFRAQVETNLFGVVNMTRAIIPQMRKQGSGYIFQISSVGGRISNPGLAAYQAAKWAVGGFSEVVSKELAPFGIHVSTLEPGGIRTEWGIEAKKTLQDLPADYQDSMGEFRALIDQYVGQEAGDPQRIAQVLVALSSHPKPPVHLILGSDAQYFFDMAEQERQSEAAQWKAVTLSTDFGADKPVLPQA